MRLRERGTDGEHRQDALTGRFYRVLDLRLGLLLHGVQALRHLGARILDLLHLLLYIVYQKQIQFLLLQEIQVF